MSHPKLQTLKEKIDEENKLFQEVGLKPGDVFAFDISRYQSKGGYAVGARQGGSKPFVFHQKEIICVVTEIMTKNRHNDNMYNDEPIVCFIAPNGIECMEYAFCMTRYIRKA